MEDRCRLRVIGITYNQIESGVYALILQEYHGDIRIPIIIGYPEAQSIECKLQEISTPRPLTHDIVASIFEDFGLHLIEIVIRKLQNGVFAADLVIEDSLGNRRTIDSRSSDAVALALRCDAPIYTSRKVIEEAGFLADASRTSKNKNERSPELSVPSEDSLRDTSEKRKDNLLDSRRSIFRRMSVSELNREMEKSVENEDYEQAARIKEELERRKNA